jgi:hypothetical protein
MEGIPGLVVGGRLRTISRRPARRIALPRRGLPDRQISGWPLIRLRGLSTPLASVPPMSFMNRNRHLSGLATLRQRGFVSN